MHDDIIKWKHFPHYWPFVRGIHQSPMNSPHKGQWRGALMFSFICAWINIWVNNREAGDLRSYWAHYVVNVMDWRYMTWNWCVFAWMLKHLANFINICWMHRSSTFTQISLLSSPVKVLLLVLPIEGIVWGAVVAMSCDKQFQTHPNEGYQITCNKGLPNYM